VDSPEDIDADDGGHHPWNTFKLQQELTLTVDSMLGENQIKFELKLPDTDEDS